MSGVRAGSLIFACLPLVGCGALLGLPEYEIVDDGGASGDGDSPSGDGDSGSGGESVGPSGDGDGSGGASSASSGGSSSSGGGSSGGNSSSGGASSGGMSSGGASSGGSPSSGGSTSGTVATGLPCTESEECASGQCFDSVCCASACDSDCVSCNQEGNLGACLPHEEGTDPDNDCGALTCDGAGECATCNDGVQNGDETDVDCGGSCLACPGGLLLTELMNAKTEAEFIEIYNPGPGDVTLEHVYLADYANYYERPTGVTHDQFDFSIHFPSGSSIAAGQYLTIGLNTDSNFNTEHGVDPDFALTVEGGNAVQMLGSSTGSTGLTNDNEMVMLFFWDGVSTTVRDIDYVSYYSTGTARAVDKSGETDYQDDTAVDSQSLAPSPGSGQALVRCVFDETGETKTNGNGFLGHDETSESMAVNWLVTATPSPGAANSCE